MKKTKLIAVFSVLMIVLFAAALLAGCKNGTEDEPPRDIHVTGITLQTVPDNSSATDKRTSYIWFNAADAINNPASLIVIQTIAPANASNKAVTWEFSGDEFATWNPTGNIVTAKKAGGTVTVTATTEDGGFIAVHNIRVLAAGDVVPR